MLGIIEKHLARGIHIHFSKLLHAFGTYSYQGFACKGLKPR